MKITFCQLVLGAKETELKINEDETKYMRTTRRGRINQNVSN